MDGLLTVVVMRFSDFNPVVYMYLLYLLKKKTYDVATKSSLVHYFPSIKRRDLINYLRRLQEKGYIYYDEEMIIRVNEEKYYELLKKLQEIWYGE